MCKLKLFQQIGHISHYKLLTFTLKKQSPSLSSEQPDDASWPCGGQDSALRGPKPSQSTLYKLPGFYLPLATLHTQPSSAHHTAVAHLLDSACPKTVTH